MRDVKIFFIKKHHQHIGKKKQNNGKKVLIIRLKLPSFKESSFSEYAKKHSFIRKDESEFFLDCVEHIRKQSKCSPTLRLYGCLFVALGISTLIWEISDETKFHRAVLSFGLSLPFGLNPPFSAPLCVLIVYNFLFLFCFQRYWAEEWCVQRMSYAVRSGFYGLRSQSKSKKKKFLLLLLDERLFFFTKLSSIVPLTNENSPSRP